MRCTSEDSDDVAVASVEDAGVALLFAGVDDGGVRSGRRESSEEMLRRRGWLRGSVPCAAAPVGREASVR